MSLLLRQHHVQIWTLSSDHNEYEQYKDLLIKSSTVETLQTSLSQSLLARSFSELSGKSSVCLLHDCSNIRKPYTQQMDLLGRCVLYRAILSMAIVLSTA